MEKYKCRICGSEDHSMILDYGDVALAGSLLSSLDEVQAEKKYPLTLVFCNQCQHVQIREVLDPALLFSDYLWETGVSTSIVNYCKGFVADVVSRVSLPEDAFVVEIASNDGTMLNEFKNTGRNVRGVDPAQRIAEQATKRGIPTHPTFFGLEIAQTILKEEQQADMIVGRNVLAHVADLHGVIGGVSKLLKAGGTAVIEVPHLTPLHEELQYDQVYHEHIGYHSLDSIEKLVRMYGMRVIDVDVVEQHGGSIRSYIAHEDDPREAHARVGEMLESEQVLLNFSAWEKFRDRVDAQKKALHEELTNARARGEVVVGYGASGKGQALIQMCGLDEKTVNYVVDRASIKHGKWTPGSHIPIFDPSHMKTAGADVLLLFSWNLAKEIVKQEEELQSKGTKFLHPIPLPHYL